MPVSCARSQPKSRPQQRAAQPRPRTPTDSHRQTPRAPPRHHRPMGPNCRQRLGPRVSVLREEHMHRFVADQRHREHHGLQSLAIYRKNGQSSTVTAQTRASTLANVRRLLRTALDTGRADRLDLDRDSSSPRRIQPTRDRAPAARSPTMWPRRWPTRRTWRGWPRSTTATTSGREGLAVTRPADGWVRWSTCGWTAPASTTGCRCSGTTRPRSATTTKPSASPTPSTNYWLNAAAKPSENSSNGTAATHRRRTPDTGAVPHLVAQPRGHQGHQPEHLQPRLPRLGRRTRPRRPLRQPPSPPHPGHQPCCGTAPTCTTSAATSATSRQP